MEQIQRFIQLHSASKNASPARRSSSLGFVFILVAGFSLTNIGMIAFGQSTRSVLAPVNPFLEYMDIFPGQPISALEARAFSCWRTYNYHDSLERTCRSTLTSGVFASIDTFTSDNIIRQMTFTLRDNRFKVGDVLLLFGDSNFRAYPHKVFFFWSDLFVIVSTTAAGNHASVRPVWSVSFANTH